MKSRQKVIQYESKLVFTNKHGFKSRPTKSLFSRHILLEFLVIRIWSYLRSCIEEIIVDILRLLANCFYHLNLIFPLLCFESSPFNTSCDHFPLRTVGIIYPLLEQHLIWSNQILNLFNTFPKEHNEKSEPWTFLVIATMIQLSFTEIIVWFVKKKTKFDALRWSAKILCVSVVKH